MMIDFPPAPPWALKLNPDRQNRHAGVLELDLDAQYVPQAGPIALVDSFFQLEGTLVRRGIHGRSAADVMCVERGLNLKRPWMLAMT